MARIQLIPIPNNIDAQGLTIIEDLPDGAVEFLWDLLLERAHDPTIAISSGHSEPRMRDHLAFVYKHPYRAWYIVAHEDGTWIGAVSLTNANEIGIHIKKEHRGQGLATAAVRAIMARHSPSTEVPSVVRGRFVANINPKNESSIRLFESLGAKLIQVTYQLPQPGEDHGQGHAANP